MLQADALLAPALRGLREAKGVVASTVISRDGLPLATDLPPGVNPDTLALRTAFMQGIGELVMESVENETARTVIIVAEEHYIMTTSVDDRSILVVVVNRSHDIGGLIPHVHHVADEIGSTMALDGQSAAGQPTP